MREERRPLIDYADRANTHRVFLAAPIFLKNAVVGATYAEFSTLQMDEALESLRQASRTRRLLTGLAIVVAINLFLYFKVHRPVKRLLTAVESVSQGTMTSVVPVEEQDELGELAGTFNDMVRKIREATHDNAQLTESLQAMNDSLQLKVSEATAEVLQKNQALAHTNELLSAAQRDAARAQRLSAIGQVAATVAHKIGTPLTALSGHIQLMAEDPTLGTESRQRLQTVEAQIERTSKIIQDLLLYARRPEPVRSPLDLNACVAECLALFQPEFDRRKIAITTEWSHQIEKVEADAQQLQEVFNSLIENALDAMPAGGTLVVRVSPEVVLSAAGPSNVGRSGTHRYRLRDERRAARTDLSAVLYDEEGRAWHGTGAGERAGNSTGTRGRNQGGERAGKRLAVHDRASNRRRSALMMRPSRVMVVDDDAETLALLREVVAKEGYEVETAEDAEIGAAATRRMAA